MTLQVSEIAKPEPRLRFDPAVGYAAKCDRPFPVPEGAKATRELLKYFPQLSIAERDRRWREIRKRMFFANLDVLLFLGNDLRWDMGMANLRYVLQIGSKMGAWAIFPTEGDPVVWHSVPHISRPVDPHLAVQEWTTDIRPFTGHAAVVDELCRRGFERSRIGLVGFSSTIVRTPTILHGDVTAFQKAMPNAEFIDVSWMLQEMRLTKSEEEIALLREAGRIARKVVDTMHEFARSGVTEAEYWIEMMRTQVINGGEPDGFILLKSGPLEHPQDELWNLLHGCSQPLSPSMRPLVAGDLIICEFHTKYGGYKCHTEFTVYMGKKAPDELKDIWKVSLECLDVSREVLVPGKTFREAWEAIRRPAEKAGYDWVELGWHAMGNGSPEFPTIIYRPGWGSPALNGHRIADFVFEEGMTFGNNIDLNNPAWKMDVGCMLSDFMVVRTGGAEMLVNVPRELGEVG